MILSLTKPKYFMPVHGEYRHLMKHAQLAEQTGMKPQNIFISEIGKVLEIGDRSARLVGSVPSGIVLIDGLGVGDVGNIVLRDRKHLSEDGIIVVVVTLQKSTGNILAGPDVISRGFVYVRESEDLMDKAKTVCKNAITSAKKKKGADWSSIKNSVKTALSDFLYEKTKRKPMILPVITEI